MSVSTPVADPPRTGSGCSPHRGPPAPSGGFQVPAPASGLPRTLLALYVAAVVLSAASTLLALFVLAPPPELDSTWLLLAAAAVAAAFPVRLPSLRVDATAVHPFVLCALAASGPLAAILIDVAGVVVSAFGRGRRPRLVHFVFNVATVVLSCSAAWWTFVALGGPAAPRPARAAIALIGAGLAYFAANAALVSVAISLEKRWRIARTLRRSCLWTALPFFSGVTIAVALLTVVDELLPWGFVLALPPCWLIISLYRLHGDRLQAE